MLARDGPGQPGSHSGRNSDYLRAAVMSPFSVFHELQDYVGFGREDQVILRSLHAGLAPDFLAVSEIFYARILEYPAAREVLERGESSVGQLRHSLVAWMDGLFQGPWDES